MSKKVAKYPIVLIAAAASNRVIGCGNTMPWRIPEDFRWFKEVTMAKPIIMGRKTFESIGKPLPGRLNIVITRDEKWQTTSKYVVVRSLKDAYGVAELAIEQYGLEKEIMVAGGGEIYAQAFNDATMIYLTEIDLNPMGDAFFPSLKPWEWTNRVIKQRAYQNDTATRKCEGRTDFSWRIVQYTRQPPMKLKSLKSLESPAKGISAAGFFPRFAKPLTA